MGREGVPCDHIPHEFSHQFDTSQNWWPGIGQEREITQEIPDEIDSNGGLSPKWFQIPCDIEYIGGDTVHFG